MSTPNANSRSPDTPIPYKLLRTASGSPYIVIPTTSNEPIYLTEFYQTDIDNLQSTLSIPSINDQLISIPKPYTRADAEWWIDQQLNGNISVPLQVIRASDPETGGLIGVVSLIMNDQERVSELLENIPSLSSSGKAVVLGYYLHPDYRGKGIIKEGVKALIQWGRRECGVGTVTVKVWEENIPSLKIVGSFKEFIRQDEEEWEEWPVTKGGGRKRLLVFNWIV